MWTSPSFSGPRPPPCADFSLTSVDLYRAILYGGRRGIDENSNDLYLIDFDNKVLISILFYTHTHAINTMQSMIGNSEATAKEQTRR